MNRYLKILACLYFLGGILHVLDLFDLRLKFSELGNHWKIWISYLCLMDLITAVGLWRLKRWGIYCLFFVMISQLIVYIGFPNYFGNQYALITFHLIILITFVIIGLNKNFHKENL